MCVCVYVYIYIYIYIYIYVTLRRGKLKRENDLHTQKLHEPEIKSRLNLDLIDVNLT